jgi:hypothetical protein
MNKETQIKFAPVQEATLKTMDAICLSVKNLDSWQKFQYLNKVRNFLDLIDLD